MSESRGFMRVEMSTHRERLKMKNQTKSKVERSRVE